MLLREWCLRLSDNRTDWGEAVRTAVCQYNKMREKAETTEIPAKVNAKQLG